MAGNINEARIALNSIQLLVEVISDYRKAAEVLKTKRKARRRTSEYRAKNLLLVLKTEHARLVNTLAHVLKYQYTDVVKDMVDWDNPRTRATLKSTFGSSLGSFFSAIRQLVECIREIEYILRIDDYDKASVVMRRCGYLFPTWAVSGLSLLGLFLMLYFGQSSLLTGHMLLVMIQRATPFIRCALRKGIHSSFSLCSAASSISFLVISSS